MYTPTTSLPSLYFFQWSTIAAPNPTLSAPLKPSDTTIYFSNPPLDHTGAIITGGFLMAIKNADSYVMTCYIAPGAVSVDGLSATVVQGIRLEGLDYTTSDPTLIPTDGFSSGDAISCNISGVIGAMLSGAIKGTIATNGLGFIMGDGTASDVTISQKDNVSTKGFLRKHVATGKVQYSNDGASWVNIDSVTASNLVAVSATDTTPSYLNDKLNIVGSGTLTAVHSTANPGGNEVDTWTLSDTATDSVVDTVYTAAENISSTSVVSKSLTADTVENYAVNSYSANIDETTFASLGTTSLVRMCYVAHNTVAAFFRAATGSLGYLVIGTQTYPWQHVSWGTPVSLGEDVGSTSICYMQDNKIAMAFRRISDNAMCVRVATISGTVPTLGADLHLADTPAASAQGYVAIACIDTDKLIFAYRAAGLAGYARCLTVTGTALNIVGLEKQVLQTGVGNAVSSLAISKVDTDKCIIFCRNETDANKGKGSLVVATGVEIAANVEVEIDANASSSFSAQQLTAGTVLVSWIGGASTYVQARVANVAGLVLTYPTVVTAVNAAASLAPSVAVITPTVAIVGYEVTAGTDGKFTNLGISGTTISNGTEYGFNAGTNNVTDVCVTKFNDNNEVMIGYVDTSDSSKGNAELYQSYDNSARALGLAVATAASGASITIREKGILDGLSALTPGTVYYGGTFSAVSATNVSGVQLGVAKNTTALDIGVVRNVGITGVTTATGANLTTLTNGSNANALHKHNKFVSSGSSTGANGTITIAHGLGVTPTLISLRAKLQFSTSGSDADNIESIGSYDGTHYGCIYAFKDGNPSFADTVSSNRIGHVGNTINGSAADGTAITVTTLDATNVILTNTVTTAGQAYYYVIEVEV